jgi:predicted Kef-type K+ transport protein
MRYTFHVYKKNNVRTISTSFFKINHFAFLVSFCGVHTHMLNCTGNLTLQLADCFAKSS